MKKHIRTRRMPDGRLPKNRKELFFDALRWRMSFLLSVGLLLLLSLLPHLATQMYYDISASVISQDTADATAALLTLKLQTALLQTVTLTWLFLGLSGIFRMLRCLAWRETEGVFACFRKGIVSGWKHAVAIGLSAGLLQLLRTLAEMLFYGFAKYLPGALYAILVVPVFLWAMTLDTVYCKRFGNLLSGAAVLYIRTAPLTLLFSLLLTAPKLLLFIPRFTLRYALFTAAVVVVAPVVLFGWTLYAFHCFDKWINRENYPDICGRGIDTQKR